MADSSVENEFVIPYGLAPDSEDPLDADKFRNYFSAQMVYHTPLTVDASGTLSSFILDSFSYNTREQTIHFELKEGLKYSDETSITIQDLTLSITRMALARPKFPVINSIVGLDAWTKLHKPLETRPKGIEVNGNKLTIHLDRNVRHPLFRFTLTLFSVIPSKVVDLSTGDLNGQKIPSSGFYTKQTQNSNWVDFLKRADAKEDTIPEKFRISYPNKSLLDVLTDSEHLKQELAVFGNDIHFDKNQMDTIAQNHVVERLAPSWFAGIVLTGIESTECRQVFAEIFRNAVQKRIHKGLIPSSSLFPEILPGYLDDKKLEASLQKLDHKTIQRCIQSIQKTGFNWKTGTTEPSPTLVQAIQDIEAEYKINFKLVKHGELDKYKIHGETIESGFWPLDPVGDIQMLLTPGLHKDLNPLTSQKSLQKLLQDLRDAKPGEETHNIMTDINRYVYKDSTLCIFSHQGYFYARSKMSKSRFESGALALSVPYPWQIFSRSQP